MAIDESRRLLLHGGLRTAVGADAALAMMEMLPPTGWGDVATRQQLDAVEARLDGRIDQLEATLDHHIETLRLEVQVLIAEGQRRMMQWTIATMIALTGVFAAIVRLS
jgi:hypothetical protein